MLNVDVPMRRERKAGLPEYNEHNKILIFTNSLCQHKNK